MLDMAGSERSISAPGLITAIMPSHAFTGSGCWLSAPASTHISPQATLSNLIWESRADTRADMGNDMLLSIIHTYVH